MIKRCLKQYASVNARFSETHLKDEPFFNAASLPSICSDMAIVKAVEIRKGNSTAFGYKRRLLVL